MFNKLGKTDLQELALAVHMEGPQAVTSDVVLVIELVAVVRTHVVSV